MTAAVPPVDVAHLDELRAMIGREPVGRMVTALLAELETAPATIAGLAGAEARAAAHRLRGAALNLGCSAIARACADIEAAAVVSECHASQLAAAAAGTRSALAAA